MRGGARARSGPPPDPDALRRERKDDKAGWVTLPAGGREGVAPVWPLTEASDRELAFWEREWSRPQAIEWERNGQEIEVAMYVRNLVEAEVPGASKAKRELLKQNMEYLGVSLPGLLRNRWRIGESPSESVSDAVSSSGNVVSIEERLAKARKAQK